MNGEDHAVVELSPRRPQFLDIIVKHILTGFTLHLNEGDLVRGHIFSLDVGPFGHPAQLCHSNPTSARQDEIDKQLEIAIMELCD